MEKLIGNAHRKLLRICRKSFRVIVDVLFPQDPVTAALEAISRGDNEAQRDFFGLLPTAPPAPPEYPWIHSCFAYKNAAVERIVWAVKYERNELLADLMAEAILAKILKISANHSQIQNQKIVIVPLSSSKKRLRERGYDHIGLIAEALRALQTKTLAESRCGFSIAISSITQKLRHTKSQSKLNSREERLHNLAGAFSIASEAGIDHTINPTHTYILIDDVCTTGATLAAARECLVAAGASYVIAVTFAR